MYDFNFFEREKSIKPYLILALYLLVFVYIVILLLINYNLKMKSSKLGLENRLDFGLEELELITRMAEENLEGNNAYYNKLLILDDYKGKNIDLEYLHLDETAMEIEGRGTNIKNIMDFKDYLSKSYKLVKIKELKNMETDYKFDLEVRWDGED